MSCNSLKLSVGPVIYSVGGAMTSARTFDLKIEQKSGPEYTFTSIAREEHGSIESFLKSKKVRVTNEMGDGDAIMAGPEDSDDEMQSVASSGEEAPKPRLGDDDEDSEEGMLYRREKMIGLTGLSRRGFSSFIFR